MPRENFRYVGLDELGDKLASMANMGAVKTIVKKNGAGLVKTMTKRAEFVKGYATGATRQSIGANSGIRDAGLSAFAGPGTEHAGYLEKGTRYMSAQPFVEPAFKEQKELFKADLDALVK